MTKFFVPLVLWAEIVGLAACLLVGVWLGRYREGYAWDGSRSQFNLHPLLLTIALIYLYGNATLIFRIFTGINIPRIAVKATHAGVFLLATLMMSVGLAAVFERHKDHERSSLYTLHDWLGLATVVMFLMQLLLGLGIFLLPFASSQLRASYLSSHVFFGIAILSLSAGTCLMGIFEIILHSKIDYGALPPPAVMANLAGLCITAFVVTVAYILTMDKAAPTNRKAKRLREDIPLEEDANGSSRREGSSQYSQMLN